MHSFFGKETVIPSGREDSKAVGNSINFETVYTRAFGNRPRNFEPWPKMRMTPELASPLQTSAPHQLEEF
ncbi:hypothetical protein TNCV_3997571 [Trichonephila clavipes]|nr:hypothetical protein TNCV_3997571 [Trichonephila clavipes]